MNNKNQLAPIVLFVYNRPSHTRRTIESLKKNYLADESMLYIYSDSGKCNDDDSGVYQVRELLKNVNGFKRVIINERKSNWGLAKNIIDGVTSLVNEYGKVIVMEDDLVTSPYFLKYMNDSLKLYADQKKVWHISGWNYPIDTSDLEDVFLWRFMNCWGWSTWSDRWRHYEKNIDKVINEFSKEQIDYINLDNTDTSWSQVIRNKEKRIDTWAIFWYLSIIRNKGLCLNPSNSLVINIGNDGSGENCQATDSFTTKLSVTKELIVSTKVKENVIAVNEVKKFYKSLKKPLLKRIFNKVKLIISKIKINII